MDLAPAIVFVRDAIPCLFNQRPLAKPIKHLVRVGKRDFILILGPGCADTLSLDNDEPLIPCGSHANRTGGCPSSDN